MSYDQPVDVDDVVMHIAPGSADAAVYQNGVLADSGHLDDVSERLITALGIDTIYDSNPFVARDARGRQAAAPDLDALEAGQAALEREA